MTGFMSPNIPWANEQTKTKRSLAQINIIIFTVYNNVYTIGYANIYTTPLVYTYIHTYVCNIETLNIEATEAQP